MLLLGVVLAGVVTAADRTDQVSAAGPTVVSGDVTVDTTWTAANSPYVVTGGDLRVMASATLTIQPGVVVRVQKPVSGAYFFKVHGTLIARGTASQPITFSSDRDSALGGSGGAARGDWWGIWFSTRSGDQTPAAESVLEHVAVRYGGYSGLAACATHQRGNVVLLDSRPLRIDHVTFAESSNAHVVVEGTLSDLGDPTRTVISNSTFDASCDGISAMAHAITARATRSTNR